MFNFLILLSMVFLLAAPSFATTSTATYTALQDSVKLGLRGTPSTSNKFATSSTSSVDVILVGIDHTLTTDQLDKVDIAICDAHNQVYPSQVSSVSITTQQVHKAEDSKFLAGADSVNFHHDSYLTLSATLSGDAVNLSANVGTAFDEYFWAQWMCAFLLDAGFTMRELHDCIVTDPRRSERTTNEKVQEVVTTFASTSSVDVVLVGIDHTLTTAQLEMVDIAIRDAHNKVYPGYISGVTIAAQQVHKTDDSKLLRVTNSVNFHHDSYLTLSATLSGEVAHLVGEDGNLGTAFDEYFWAQWLCAFLLDTGFTMRELHDCIVTEPRRGYQAAETI